MPFDRQGRGLGGGFSTLDTEAAAGTLKVLQPVATATRVDGQRAAQGEEKEEVRASKLAGWEKSVSIA